MTHAVAAAHLAGLRLLRDASGLLAEHGITPMPLKGLWLQRFAYDEPQLRPITDVDVLVGPAHFDRALAALQAGGFRPFNREAEEVALAAPGHPLPLDLHRELFTRGAFHLRATAMLERGTRDDLAFGCPTINPDPLDVFAHLVGHFVKSGSRPDDRAHMSDFGRMLQAGLVDPDRCAAHLTATGLQRAARYVLSMAAQQPGGEGCSRIVRALAPDPLGSLLAMAVHAYQPRFGDVPGLRAMPGFALDSSLMHGARAAALRTIDLADAKMGRGFARSRDPAGTEPAG